MWESGFARVVSRGSCRDCSAARHDEAGPSRQAGRRRILRAPRLAGVGAAAVPRAVDGAGAAPLEPSLESALSRFRKSATETDKSSSIVDSVAQLQTRRVQNVLLMCSDYDSYTFEEDGLLTELIYSEYDTMNLRKPPTIERVSSPEKALARMKEQEYDLLITLMRMEGSNMTPQSFVTAVHAMEPSMPIALLALNAFELRELDPRVDQALKINVNKRLTWEAGGGGAAVAAASPSSADALADAWVWPFLWQGNASLFTAMFKVVEDRLNAAQDTDFGVQLVLLIEDNVKFYSSYLPVLYQELLKQNQALQSETMGSREKLLRMHSRPKVMLCTNYEEAADIFRRYSPNVMGVITDAGFPRNGEHDLTAGLKLAAEALEHAPELPVLVQSGDSKLATKVEALGAKFVSKESNVLLASLRDFMTQELKLGPLEFLDGVTGAKLGEVSTVTELVETWAQLPLQSVAYHGRHAHLSKWFFARAEFQLAKRFRASSYPNDFIDADGNERPDWLRNWILSEARAHRNKLASGVENASARGITDFDSSMVRYGKGALGGKGRGFRFLHSVSDKFGLQTIIPELRISVPNCFVLATEVFDRFLDENQMRQAALEATADEDLVKLFDAAPLPADVSAELQKYVAQVGCSAARISSRLPHPSPHMSHPTHHAAQVGAPIAVRSSSMFEDAFLQPFAGVYSSFMLPNDGGEEQRLAQLEGAVKRVYASTFCQAARGYIASTQNRLEEEKMAIIVQELVGEADGHGHFHPSLAGVANSIDFYPRPHTSHEHGCAQLSLGLGAAVVGGTPSVQFSLADPATATVIGT